MCCDVLGAPRPRQPSKVPQEVGSRASVLGSLVGRPSSMNVAIERAPKAAAASRRTSPWQGSPSPQWQRRSFPTKVPISSMRPAVRKYPLNSEIAA
jgi:hypothetical protein